MCDILFQNGGMLLMCFCGDGSSKFSPWSFQGQMMTVTVKLVSDIEITATLWLPGHGIMKHLRGHWENSILAKWEMVSVRGQLCNRKTKLFLGMATHDILAPWGRGRNIRNPKLASVILPGHFAYMLTLSQETKQVNNNKRQIQQPHPLPVGKDKILGWFPQALTSRALRWKPHAPVSRVQKILESRRSQVNNELKENCLH